MIRLFQTNVGMIPMILSGRPPQITKPLRRVAIVGMTGFEPCSSIIFLFCWLLIC